MSSRVLRNQGGFTLLEGMIGLTLLTVGLLGIASLGIATIRANGTSKEVTQAVILSEEKMEEVKRLGMNEPEVGASSLVQLHVNKDPK